MIVYTENSTYEFKEDEKVCRRVPSSSLIPLRKDAEWNKYYTVHAEVGAPMRIILEHLSGDEQQLTLRTTTTVTKIQK